MFQIENIPDTCRLLYRVHKNYIKDNKLVPGVFCKCKLNQDKTRNMSTDWGKYSTPQESRNRAKNPSLNGIVGLIVGKVRDIPLEVIHNPDLRLNNQAHTDVKMNEEDCKNKERIRLELMSIYFWLIDIRD